MLFCFSCVNIDSVVKLWVNCFLLKIKSIRVSEIVQQISHLLCTWRHRVSSLLKILYYDSWPWNDHNVWSQKIKIKKNLKYRFIFIILFLFFWATHRSSHCLLLTISLNIMNLTIMNYNEQFLISHFKNLYLFASLWKTCLDMKARLTLLEIWCSQRQIATNKEQLLINMSVPACSVEVLARCFPVFQTLMNL